MATMALQGMRPGWDAAAAAALASRLVMDDIMDELASDDDSESDLSDFIFDGVRSTHARLYMFWHWVTSR
jgi:hypothetical protein